MKGEQVPNANFDVFNETAYVERLCAQWETALLCVGSHSKKKPHSLTIARLFNNHLLDAIQFTVLSHRPISAFRGTKCQLGAKPCLVFSGEPWQSQETYRHLANLFIDFFRGRIVSQISLVGLDHVLVFVALDDQRISLRHYTIHLKRSGTKVRSVSFKLPFLPITSLSNKLLLTYSSCVKDPACGVRRDGTCT
jgi:ribosome production factor 2